MLLPYHKPFDKNYGDSEPWQKSEFLSDDSHHDRVSHRIDLTELAEEANGDVSTFFELFETQCNAALSGESESVDIKGLSGCIKTLDRHRHSRLHHDVKANILVHIDEIRKAGEVSFPVFNVSVM